MSRGKLNNTSQESTLDKVNKFLARLMGKKDSIEGGNKPSNNTPSNARFMLIISAVVFILWLLTGLYYVPKNKLGLLLYDGKVSKTITGMEVGLTKPFPFSDLVIIDNDNTAFSIGKESDNNFSIISSDNKEIKAVVEVDYSFKNPTLYFENFYQDSSDIDNKLVWLTEAGIQNYLVQYSESEILSTSKLVLATEISSKLNVLFEKYGIYIEKINLVSFDAKNTIDVSNSNSSLTESIVSQAKQYATDKQTRTMQIESDYYDLLPQYQKNNRIVEDMLYYRMLSQVSESTNKTVYPLLNLSKQEFLSLESEGLLSISNAQIKNTADKSSDPRQLDRNVVRSRVFLDR